MTSKPVIYISSTFFDLEEHRRNLIDTLLSTQKFDVRGMENYGTSNQAPLAKCLNDVEQAEFYVLLLGNRYGFIPEGYDLSITNLEYKKAIGDDDMTRVAGKPAYNNRCVLPFIADNKYVLNAGVQKAMDDERQKDGDLLSTAKDKKLEELKNQIKKDFVIDKAFTSPDDLVKKVFGAMFSELMDRGYISLVQELKMHDEIVFRCDRVKPREDFLFKNYRKFRTFIVHGEEKEMPEVFMNNISHYDLNIDEGRSIEIKNLDEYTSSKTEKFLSSLAFSIYYRIYADYPETDDFNFEQLADKLRSDITFTDRIVRIEISYSSWVNYYQLIEALFAEMNRLKPLLSGQPNLYLVMIIRYMDPENNLDKEPESTAVLDKLRSLKVYDIEEWIGTYFCMNKSIANINRTVLITREIIQYYFKDWYENDESFSMADAVNRLSTIVSDFNNNSQLFANYQTLYNRQ